MEIQQRNGGENTELATLGLEDNVTASEFVITFLCDLKDICVSPQRDSCRPRLKFASIKSTLPVLTLVLFDAYFFPLPDALAPSHIFLLNGHFRTF